MRLFFFFLCCAIVDHSLAGLDPTAHENWPLLKNRNCESHPTSRIVEGQKAKVGEFPWIAGLVYKKRDGKAEKYLCSGTILNKNTIITTARCVAVLPNDVEYLVFVVLGDLDKTQIQECGEKVCAPPAQHRYLKEIIHHKNYDAAKNWNDIALLRVSPDIEFNSYVWPICIPHGDLLTNTFIGDDAVVIGWGATNATTKEHSNALLKVGLKVRDPSVCKNQDQINFDPEFQWCASGEKSGPGPCFGDQGGPLMIVRDLKTYLIGLYSYNGASTTEKCGDHENPPVFVKVSAYLEWILDNLVVSQTTYQTIAVFLCGDGEIWCKLFFSTQ